MPVSGDVRGYRITYITIDNLPLFRLPRLSHAIDCFAPSLGLLSFCCTKDFTT